MDDRIRRTWQEALAYCSTSSLRGHNDWRLPSINEMQSIVDYTRMGPSIDPKFDVEDTTYMTSTTGIGNYSSGWWVSFSQGDIYVGPKGWSKATDLFDYVNVQN
ncbi:MAG: DUF1566 domain-containing protein [Proteobacteria bacterium]|nr:DUF1566 domain-containing protein [Pseudomonadota bacterium]